MKILILKLLLYLSLTVGVALPIKGVPSKSVRQEIQVVDRNKVGIDTVYGDFSYWFGDRQSSGTEQGLTYDSLVFAMPFIRGLSTIPKISNYNNVNFVYEDSLLTENMVKLLNEISKRYAKSIETSTQQIIYEIGVQANQLMKISLERDRIRSKTYLAWPVFIVLSVILLAFGTVTERRLLQYIAAAIVVASVIGTLYYLPDIIVNLGNYNYDAYNFLKTMY